jgi:hypothetical protein
MGKHYGAFAKGFSDSMIAMLGLKMQQEHIVRYLRITGAGSAVVAAHRQGGLSRGAIAGGQEQGRWAEVVNTNLISTL